VAVGQRHEQAFDVDAAVVAPVDVADHAGAVRLEQRAGGLDAAGRVVVARDEHDVEPWRALARLLEETVQLFLRLGRRVGVVEDVAGDEQRVGLLGHDGVEQPVEEALVLVGPFVIVQGLAEMPVGGVQQPHEVA